MSDTIEYRAEYFNKAYQRWEPLRLRTSPITPEVWPKIVQGLEENAQGVKFRLAMRTCSPWCECQVQEGAK